MTPLKKYYVWGHLSEHAKPGRAEVYLAADVEAWLEANVEATEENGLHVCVDTLLAHLKGQS